MARNRAQKVWPSKATSTGLPGSTSTGTSAWAYFGDGQRFLTAYIANASTAAFVNAIEVSAGSSTAASVVLAAATSTGANAVRSSTGGSVFDKARVVVSGNATTGDVTVVIAAAP